MAAFAAWLVVTDRWLAGESQWRIVLVVASAVCGAVLAAGWLVIGWQARTRRAPASARPGEISPPVSVTLAELQALSPGEFEAWVQRLFKSRGFYAENTPDSADHGIDLRLIAPDGERSVVQCKRYGGVVGEPAIRDLYGVMRAGQHARGYLVTTGRFSVAARRWARGKPLELIDGQRLVRLATIPPVPHPLPLSADLDWQETRKGSQDLAS